MTPVIESNIKIKTYDFSPEKLNELKSDKRWINRPVVYVLHNDKWLYVWETSSAIWRMNEHGKTNKKNLKNIEIIFDDTFNKSAILDIEQNLIKLFNADWKFTLWNQNWWQSTMHDYYQREAYVSKIDIIWEKLKARKLCIKSIDVLRNSELFKYSPYNSLTEEQDAVSKAIIRDMIEKLSNNEEWLSIIKWWAWTWKTIVLVNMMYKLINAMNTSFDKAVDEDLDLSDYVQLVRDIQDFITIYKKWKPLKIAYVAQMDWLRDSIKVVFSKTKNWLKADMAKWPTQIVNDYYKTKEKFDIVFVDEAHRLCQYKNINRRWKYKEAAIKCWMNPEDYTCLDFILHCSKYRVLVYDDKQTVKWSDITPEQFKRSLRGVKPKIYELSTQMRCKWWDSYFNYVNDILNCKWWLKKQEVINWYEFKMYYDVDKMVKKIKELDNTYWLCRNVAWEAWPWNTKKKKIAEIKEKNLYDIEIWEYKYVWNTRVGWWIVSKNAINEIWCIHTVQWYDLNYVWIIFGQEIDYDEKNNEIIVDRSKFYDKYIKQWADDETFYDYILNAYKVVMTRWIRWCFVYAYNEWMRKYLSKFIDKA